jgi:regulatory protein
VKKTGPLTREELDAVALRYLNRFDSSAKNLTRILSGYVKKVARERGAEAALEGGELVQALVSRYVESGLVNDARFADAMAAGLRRRGSSRRAIAMKLGMRGVSAEVAAQALCEVDRESGGDAELEAARAFVRRRRLGKFRPEAERAGRRNKDLAALARAGFGFDVARAALGSADRDENEDEP